ncbi:MAG TPA: LLM class flavin-dependent oxidoreductase [Acidimicrobiales bacterium]|nr:LLM class flavin-dependent oxidoreductase [Acidimicrobiales bacterium]
MVKVGVTLPQFRHEADTALAAARQAEELGLDGVFVFDHLWPMGSPDRPIISAAPVLGALAAATTSIAIGTLVMRIGLVPDELLVDQLRSVADICDGRLIAGLGTGDRLSAEENLAYGVPYPPADLRRQSLRDCAGRLCSDGIPVWIGAGASVAPGTRAVAAEVGAAVNVWNTGVAAVEAEDELEVTWGGPLPGGPRAMASRMGELAGAGASWVVCAWPDSLDDVATAARSLPSGG